jgi:hypothetical protein
VLRFVHRISGWLWSDREPLNSTIHPPQSGALYPTTFLRNGFLYTTFGFWDDGGWGSSEPRYSWNNEFSVAVYRIEYTDDASDSFEEVTVQGFSPCGRAWSNGVRFAQIAFEGVDAVPFLRPSS